VSDVLVVQNSPIEGIGTLGKMLQDDGFTLKFVHAKSQTIPKEDCSLAVFLGGPESANDSLPYIDLEIKEIRRLVRNDVPVLGVCLGAQLIAKAFDARVFPGRTAEIGFFDDLRITGQGSKLFAGFRDPFSAFHWHAETFDLPVGAARLAYSEQYENQAIQIKSAVGLQFHLEVDSFMVRSWLERMRDESAVTQNTNTNSFLANDVFCEMKTFYRNYKAVFGL